MAVVLEREQIRTETEWPEVTLKDHVDLLTGYPFKSAQYTEDENDIRLLRGDNIAQGYLRWDKAKRWNHADYDSLSKFQLKEGDVILAMDRPWIEAGLKYSWIKTSDLPCLLVQRVSRLRGINGLDTNFLRYIISNPEFTGYVKSILTGVNVPHISPTDIKAYQFRLPPLQTQQKIAAILSAYDDLIENNLRRIKLLEAMAQALYREWFVHFRYPGHAQVPLVDSPLGPIPQGWGVKAASEAIEINPRTQVPRDALNPFITMDSLSTNSMVIGEVIKKQGNSGSKFKNGDTLFARITPCLENGKTGFVQFLPSDEQAACGSTEFIALRSRTLTPEFVYLLARTDDFRNNAIQSMSGASGRQRVHSGCFDKYLLANPDPATLEKFSEITRPMFNLIHSLSLKNKNLRQTRDLLLPRLISGQLDVGNLNILETGKSDEI